MRQTGCDRRGLDASATCAQDALRIEAGELARLGWCWVVRDGSGRLVEFHLSGLTGDSVPDGAECLGRDLREALESYERGEDRALAALPLVPAPTDFARRVRQAMRNIPYGQVQTYGQLAREVGSPGAARAIGGACGANPLPLVVPCHRVVAANGLGGFALGLDAKRELLALEGFDVARCAGFR